MTPFLFTEEELEEARKENRRLARMPRFRIRGRVEPMLMQGLLRLSQIGADRRVRKAGLALETRVAEADGHRVPVRVLRAPGRPVRGVVLDIHGGGWAVGNARMDDAFNAAFIRACGVVTVSVDYRLAVRAPIEGLMQDCLAAARWALGGDVPEWAGLPVIVTGESAGGHLAAATLLRLKAWPDLLGRVAGALLHYGVYDLSGTESVRRAGPETLLLDGPGMVKALGLLTPGLDEAGRRAPHLSPLHGDLSGMPPALMFVGDLDPLLDDTLAMAARWREAAPVEMHRLPESPHGYIHFPTAMARHTLRRGHEWIGERLTSRLS